MYWPIDAYTPGTPRTASCALGGSGWKPLAVTAMSARTSSSRLPVIEVLRPGGEDRDEDDEREADHQRGRGASPCGPGCASRSRAPAGRARRRRAPAAGRSRRRAAARRSGRRARRRRRAARRRRRARPGGSRRARRRTGPAAGASSPSRLTAAATYGVRRRPRGCAAVSASACSADTGGTRVARTAGTIAASSVTPMPTPSEMTIVRPASTSPLEGRSSAASKSAPSSAAIPSPANRPSTDAATPMASASTATAVRTCPRVDAERAQQRELARPLRDGDREGVEDDERADEQRRAGEREQRRREEAADRVVGGVGLLGGVRGAGLDGHGAGQLAAHRGGEALGRHARVGGDDDARQLAGALEPALDVGEPRHDERGAADRHPVAPLPDAGDHDALDAGARASARRAGRRAGPGRPPAGRSTTTSPGRRGGPPVDVAEGVERLAASRRRRPTARSRWRRPRRRSRARRCR